MRSSLLSAWLATGALAASSTNSSTATQALLSDGYVQLSGDTGEAYNKAKQFVSGLTNEEKVSIITGGSLTGNTTWTALIAKDGVAGVNFQFHVSGFSSANAVAMSWDRDLIEKQFRKVGDEFYALGYNLIDGPEPGPLGRVALGGRTPETFSADPYLSGIAMDKAVRGMNAAGVVTAGRHWLLNEQETNRTSGTGSSESYSSNADDKTIHELYSWPFADGVHAGMMAVMCGMNRVNQTYSCENNPLVSGLLKKEIGFPGMVFPDVNSQITALGSANGGLDYGSSSLWTTEVLEAAISNGSFTQERLDDMAVRNVIGYYHAGLDNGKQPSQAGVLEYRNVRADHNKFIRQAAGQSIVLLKNDNDGTRGLPLNKPRTISLFGAHAGPAIDGPNHAFTVNGASGDTYQGHLASATGSGSASMPYLITPQHALTQQAIEDNSMIWWIMNDTFTASSGGGMGGGMPSGDMPGGNSTDGPGGMPGGNSTMPGGDSGGGSGGVPMEGTGVTHTFSSYAENSDACLVFLNSFSGEGADRSELYNDDQDELVNTIASNCNNTIVVINTSGPRVLSSWADHTNVTGILYSNVLGQESGHAIADVLYGTVNPSAKLTHTIAKSASDYPATVCDTADCDFSEGLNIDYRHFDAQNISVSYPFGHGLSYTSFQYGDVSAQIKDQNALRNKYPSGKVVPGGEQDLWNEVITVRTTIRNTGKVGGAEVAQLYITFPDEAAQPVRVLRGFQKVYIEAGRETTVTFNVRRRDVSYWDTAAQKWAVAEGDYTLHVGSSSRDLRGSAKLTI